MRYMSNIALMAFTIFFTSCVGNNAKGVKILTNKRGETFTFHGNGTASVVGPFQENLGTHSTNNSDPKEFDKIQLIKEGDKSVVYVGLLGTASPRFNILISINKKYL